MKRSKPSRRSGRLSPGSARGCTRARATGGSSGRSRRRPAAAEANRFALLELDGAPAALRDLPPRPEVGRRQSPSGRVVVVEAIGAAPQAVAELWRFLLDIDWVETITASLLPPDHPLFFLLAEPRRMRYRLGRRALGATRRRGRSARRAHLLRRARPRVRGARRLLPVERGPLAPRRHLGRAHRGPLPISRSTSPLSAPPTSAGSASPSSRRAGASRS